MAVKNEAIRRRVQSAAEAALDKKAFDLEILDVTGLTSIGDFFLICSTGSERQATAVSEGIEERLRKDEKLKPSFIEGRRTGRWILMDYGDFVIHVFTRECRQFYSLERLWGDAPNVTADLVPQGD